MNVDGTAARRRRFLARTWRSLLAAGAGAAAAPASPAAARLDKLDVAYQDRPKDRRRCAACRFYSAREPGKGECAMVAGEIAPDGWCVLFAPR